MKIKKKPELTSDKGLFIRNIRPGLSNEKLVALVKKLGVSKILLQVGWYGESGLKDSNGRRAEEILQAFHESGVKYGAWLYTSPGLKPEEMARERIEDVAKAVDRFSGQMDEICLDLEFNWRGKREGTAAHIDEYDVIASRWACQLSVTSYGNLPKNLAFPARPHIIGRPQIYSVRSYRLLASSMSGWSRGLGCERLGACLPAHALWPASLDGDELRLHAAMVETAIVNAKRKPVTPFFWSLDGIMENGAVERAVSIF